MIAGPLTFAAQDQIGDQTTQIVEAVEDCANSIDDDGDERIDCEDTDCVEDINCKGGY